MSAVNNVAEYCQETYKATAEGGLTRVVVLLTDTLESNETLRVQHIPAVGAEVTDAASHTDRPHDCLTAIGMKTRVVFATAIARRFLCRYSSTCLNARTHLFDHTILLSPRFRKMNTSICCWGRRPPSRAATWRTPPPSRAGSTARSSPSSPRPSSR